MIHKKTLTFDICVRNELQQVGKPLIYNLGTTWHDSKKTRYFYLSHAFCWSFYIAITPRQRKSVFVLCNAPRYVRSNAFTTGSINLKSSAVTDHAKSKLHKQALRMRNKNRELTRTEICERRYLQCRLMLPLPRESQTWEHLHVKKRHAESLILCIWYHTRDGTIRILLIT